MFRSIATVSAAGVMAVAISAAVEAQSAVPAAAAAQDDTPITVAGCVVRDADYARAAGGAPPAAGSTAQFVLAGPTPYSVTGTREADLARHLGRRIEVTGTVEQARAAAAPGAADSGAGGRAGRVVGGLPPSGANGVTSGGTPAHEAGDAVPGTRPPTVVAPQVSETTPPIPLQSLPRLNVVSYRAMDGRCDDLLARTASAPRETTGSAPRTSVPARAAIGGSAGVSARSVTVVGCLVRQTSAGGALTAQPAEGGAALALTRVSMTPTSAAPASAVPGSAPSGSGSGTIPNPPAAGRVPDTSPDRSIAVDAAHEGEIAGLAKYVGQRVEISGTVQDASGTATASAADASRRSPGGVGTTGSAETPAHTSAPAERITMISFRPVGGTCN